MKVLIRNGSCIDGKGNPPRKQDVLIIDDRIASISDRICISDADVDIDAAGQLVTPGFIDMHRHADSMPMLDKDFGKLENLQGITTVISGNCGMAPVPFTDMSGTDVLDLIQPCLGNVGEGGTFRSYDEYADALKASELSLNFGFLAGTGAIKSAVKGFGKSPFTENEMKQARYLLEQGLEAGAFGVSIGIMYPPECYSSTEEYVRLLEPLSSFNGLICCHMRGEGDSLVDSVAEIIDIAERSGCNLNISHFKSTGRRNWRKRIYEGAALIDAARARGIVDVSCDFYPYECGSSTIQSLIPPECMQSSIRETVRYLSSDEGIDKIRSLIMMKIPGWDNMVESIGWDRIIVGSVEAEDSMRAAGKSFASASSAAGIDEAALLCKLFAENDGHVGVILNSMDESDVDFVASLPYASVISDALYGSGRYPHPRLYGAFPRFINRFVSEKRMLSIEDAIYRVTGLPAHKLGLCDRGTLEEGMAADINIFSLDEFRDTATYEDPVSLAEGLRYSFINGEASVIDGIWQGRKGVGCLLRR